MKRCWFIRLEFKPQDLWVGVFWKRGNPILYGNYGWGRTSFDIWVCILPMLPIHFGWMRR